MLKPSSVISPSPYRVERVSQLSPERDGAWGRKEKRVNRRCLLLLLSLPPPLYSRLLQLQVTAASPAGAHQEKGVKKEKFPKKSEDGLFGRMMGGGFPPETISTHIFPPLLPPRPHPSLCVIERFVPPAPSPWAKAAASHPREIDLAIMKVVFSPRTGCLYTVADGRGRERESKNGEMKV